MKRFSRILFLILVIFLPLTVRAQEQKKETDKSKLPMKAWKQRRENRKKWKEQDKSDKIHEKAVSERHKRLQTKKTLKRMKETKKKSEKYKSKKP